MTIMDILKGLTIMQKPNASASENRFHIVPVSTYFGWSNGPDPF